MTKSYVYFSLTGDNFDPEKITKTLGITPTESWKKGDLSKNLQQQKFSCWKLSSIKKEQLDINELNNLVINQLVNKEPLINALKSELNLDSVLQLVVCIDMNESVSTPFIGHDLKTIEFLNNTKSTTDIDIYKYDSTNE